jgi:hypothetical protein
MHIKKCEKEMFLCMIELIIGDDGDEQDLSVISYKNTAGLGVKFELTKYEMDDIIISLTDVRGQGKKSKTAGAALGGYGETERRR